MTEMMSEKLAKIKDELEFQVGVRRSRSKEVWWRFGEPREDRLGDVRVSLVMASIEEERTSRETYWRVMRYDGVVLYRDGDAETERLNGVQVMAPAKYEDAERLAKIAVEIETR